MDYRPCQFCGARGPAVMRERQGTLAVICFQCIRRFAHEIEPRDTSQPYTCGFCGRGREEVKRLIVGPAGAVICNECTELFHEIVTEAPQPPLR